MHICSAPQRVMSPDWIELSAMPGLTDIDVPDEVLLPDYEPWSASYSFGNLEMDAYNDLLVVLLNAAIDAGYPVYALRQEEYDDDLPHRYTLAKYNGTKVVEAHGTAIDPYNTPGLLVLTPEGLLEAEDLWETDYGAPARVAVRRTCC